MHTFNQGTLMQYLYNETPVELSMAIEKAMEEDWELQEEVTKLKRTIKQLDSLSMRSPRKQTIDAIMNYAASKDSVINHR